MARIRMAYIGGGSTRGAFESFQLCDGQPFLVLMRLVGAGWTGRATKGRIAIRQKFKNLRPMHVSHPNTPQGGFAARKIKYRIAICNAATANARALPPFRDSINDAFFGRFIPEIAANGRQAVGTPSKSVQHMRWKSNNLQAL